jgi:predicted RNase H-like HicB family nuclease
MMPPGAQGFDRFKIGFADVVQTAPCETYFYAVELGGSVPHVHFLLKFQSKVYALISMTIETALETDGCWLAEVVEIAGALAYGATRIANAQAMALRVMAERLEHGEIT